MKPRSWRNGCQRKQKVDEINLNDIWSSNFVNSANYQDLAVEYEGIIMSYLGNTYYT